MNKGSTWWIVFFVFVIVLVAGMRYYDYVLKQNFLLEVAVICDPTMESCFVSDCDIMADAECDQSPYKKVEILARNAPKCLEEHTCESFSCGDVEVCSTTYCSDDTLEGGEICLNLEPSEENVTEIEESI